MRSRRRVPTRVESGPRAGDPHDRAEFASDVEYYLQLEPRQLPSRYLYDELGSALFEAISVLPWYPITRAETSLLRRHGREVLDLAGPVARLVELGPGSGDKLVTLVRAAGQSPTIDLHLVDVSSSALNRSRQTIGALDDVRIVTHEARYETGLHQATAEPVGGRTLVLFLGSNIGNFDRPAAEALLRSVRSALVPGDAFLLGADLVKAEGRLLLAYDDPLGVTAAFNANLLVRINRELGGDFDVSGFSHRAVWNRSASRVEMHLVSRSRQRVRVPAARVDLVFEAGEMIWTESSYKFRRRELADRLEQTGFRVVRQWIDRARGFALTLARVSEGGVSARPLPRAAARHTA
jgi:dimethylhistidine N-methyltransferase